MHFMFVNKSKSADSSLVYMCAGRGVWGVWVCVHTDKRGISFVETALISVCKHGVINSLCILCQQTHTIRGQMHIYICSLWSADTAALCDACLPLACVNSLFWVTAAPELSDAASTLRREPPGWRLTPPPLAVLRASSSHHCPSSSTLRTADPPGPCPPSSVLLMARSFCLCRQAPAEPRGANAAKPKSWWRLFPTDSGSRLLLSAPDHIEPVDLMDDCKYPGEPPTDIVQHLYYHLLQKSLQNRTAWAE